MDSTTNKPALQLPDLETLLTRAVAKQTPHKPRRKPTDTITAKELAEADRRMKERFTLPQNWERTRVIALIHEETETFLGQFAEFVHKLTPGCRRLVRVTEPTAVGEFEHVSGAHWLNPAPMISRAADTAEVAEEQREAIVDLHLPELDNVFSPTVEVSVHLLWGGIHRVELVNDTYFYSKDRRVHLCLPAGLDVLEGMSLDCKLKLREWLGL